MLKPHTVLGLGLWLIAIRLLNVPSIWKIRLYILTGVVLVLTYLYHLWKQTVVNMLSLRGSRIYDHLTLVRCNISTAGLGCGMNHLRATFKNDAFVYF